LHPAQVLALARNMGAHFNRILVVGCEPRVLDSEDNDYIGLSRDVEAAVDPSIEIIRGLVQESNAEVAVFAEAGEGY
jgi:hydrogenase maturation protease